MKKLILIFALAFSFSLNAQNTTLAKINFEAAEEAYNNSNYELALEKLTKAEEFFGQINLPILYLRVINQDKLLAQKPSFTLLQELKNNCTSFLSNYSDDSEAFEKIKEVYNIDERWSNYKTEADFETFLKGLDNNKNREKAIALAKEIEQDYQTIVETTVGKNSSNAKIDFGFDFNTKTYLLQRSENGNVWDIVFLNDIKEVQFKSSKIVFHKNQKNQLGSTTETIRTVHGKVLKDKLLQLVKLLETIE